MAISTQGFYPSVEDLANVSRESKSIMAAYDKKKRGNKPLSRNVHTRAMTRTYRVK